jgi:hypothetical protein
LGIRELFKKRGLNQVVGTKVLVASLDPKFAEVASADCACYSQFYPTPTQSAFENVQELFAAISEGYDVVHLFCDVTSSGNITDVQGHEASATGLIQGCTQSDVKLLWVASENKGEDYIAGFKAAHKPLNLVLTLDRRGSCFTDFLQNILRKMSAGETMPAAWVSLSPQSSNDPRNQDAPACFFAAGRGAVRLR